MSFLPKLLLFLFASACSGTSFQSPGAAPTPTSAGAPGEPGSNFSSRPEEDAANQAGLGAGAGCVRDGVEDINVVLVLDNSGSQDDTDPTGVRRLASLDFAAKLDSVAKSNPKLKVSVSTISFARSVEFTSNRWVKLGDATGLARVNADINQATGPTRNGTYYAPALRSAAQLLGEIGTDSGKKAHRNFVLFMTDGKPNGAEQSAERQTELGQLTGRFDAAIIGVASGTGIDGDQVPEVEALAKPVSNPLKPKHIGQYIRARSADDVTRAFQQAFDRISNCS